MAKHPLHAQQGLTLLELSVVLLVLVALAGLAIPYVAGIGPATACRVTGATLAEIRGAILGGGAGPGFAGDLLGELPRDPATVHDYTLHFLFDQGAWAPFNPNTARGWRGPYLLNGRKLAGGILDGSFANVFDAASNPGGTVHVSHNDGNLSHVLDAWGRPIVLQIPHDGSDYRPDRARLVSAGPGSGTGPGQAAIDTSINDVDANARGDDRVLYLHSADAGANAPCR